MKTVAAFRKKRYRVFYRAGLISLVLLPLLGVYYLKSQEELKPKNVIEVNFWNPNQSKNSPNFYPDPVNLRKYKELILTGNKIQDNLKLKEARINIQQMLERRDTITGVHIIYEPRVKYESMIQAYNICLEEKANNWFSYKNNLWVIYNNPSKIIKQVYSESSWMCETASLYEYSDFLQRFPVERKNGLGRTLNLFKELWPVAFLYFGLVYLSIKNLRNRAKTYLPTTSH